MATIELTNLLATFCCGVFFGAALYISVVQHPAALETGNEFAARFFGPMYRRAAVLQASLAVLGCAAAIAAWLSDAGHLWLAAGVLIGSVIPFTLIEHIANRPRRGPFFSVEIEKAPGASIKATGSHCRVLARFGSAAGFGMSRH